MIAIFLTIIVFGLVMALLAVGLIATKKPRLKKTCGQGLASHQADSQGRRMACETCTCAIPSNQWPGSHSD